jgi:hypothetical protein
MSRSIRERPGDDGPRGMDDVVKDVALLPAKSSLGEGPRRAVGGDFDR